MPIKYKCHVKPTSFILHSSNVLSNETMHLLHDICSLVLSQRKSACALWCFGRVLNVFLVSVGVVLFVTMEGNVFVWLPDINT